MGSSKKLSVWVIIGLLTTAITIPANGSESEESTNGAGRRHQKMEEVIVELFNIYYIIFIVIIYLLFYLFLICSQNIY